MAWTEQQRRMLAEMGLPPWLAPAAAEPGCDPSRGDQAAAQTSAPASPDRAVAATLVGPVQRVPLHGTSSGLGASVPATSGVMPDQVVADMDWPALRSSVAACTACGLCKGRTQTVFGVGNTSAHWMVVGEAPGEQEDRQGEPFVGRSGQLLDNMLRALGLTRDEAPPDRQVFIANTLKCRPPGNRNPMPEELATCEPFLIRQVALVRPRIILAMGRFAVQSLLRSSEPIGRLRGRVHEYQGVPLIVTYHPAYLLRNPEEKARSWDDLCLAAETAAAG